MDMGIIPGAGLLGTSNMETGNANKCQREDPGQEASTLALIYGLCAHINYVADQLAKVCIPDNV